MFSIASPPAGRYACLFAGWNWLVMQLGPVRQALRWYIKKTARWGMAAVSKLIDATSTASGPAVRVLTYHRFGHSRQDPFCVAPEDFDAHLGVLAEQKRAVSLEQVYDFVHEGRALPRDACLVTIDDGMISTLEIALPLLEKHGVPAVAFVSSKLVGLDARELEERYMTWDELKKLTASGLVDVGSHAHTHRSLGELPLEEARAEAETSRRELTEQLGCDVTSFAYPFGMAKDFSESTDTILKNAGYAIAFNSMHGSVHAGMDPVSLPRVKVEGGESTNLFAAISRGALDRWRLIDDRFWRLQRVRSEIT